MVDVLSPLALPGGRVSRNRVWLAPLTNMQSHHDGTLADDELRFLSMRADGGFGLITTCAAFVAPEGKAWQGELGVHDDAMSPGLTRLAARIHEGGALVSAQLFHGGVRADPEVSGLPRWSASASEDPPARAATVAEIEGVIEAFVRAAERCDRAGFDAVELHGAHGYLLSQFLSTVFNRRDDAWGGSFANRAELLRRVVREIKRRAPRLLLVVRMSPEDWGQAKGLDLDESLELARWLRDDGMDVLHLSLWRAVNPTTKRPEQHPTALFREAVGAACPIVVAGTIWTREEAEQQLALGADAVALGRAAICNHDWPVRVREGRALRRTPIARAELLEEGLSPAFVGYMKMWKNFLAD